jgi:hypothetical protein
MGLSTDLNFSSIAAPQTCRPLQKGNGDEITCAQVCTVELTAELTEIFQLPHIQSLVFTMIGKIW